jgi:hypothetical protein
MTFLGLTIDGSRDAGGQLITYFAIPVGRESAAGHDVLACLADGAEVCLSNDLNDGSEGCTLFCR